MLEDRNLLSTFTVDHLADDLVGSGLNGSLRYAITNAADNDTITFTVNGTINLTGALPDLAHSVSIQGPGANNLTVRRDTGGNYRIFTVDSGTSASISGLTIANGALISASGGGIWNGGTLTLNNTTVSGNHAVNGGGIYNMFGTVTLNNSTFTSNSCDIWGGGICNSNYIFGGGTVTLNNTTVSGNSATVGGGGISNFGTLTLNNTTVSGNSAAGEGGGIDNEGTATVSNSTLSGNTTGNIGGGIYNDVVLTVSNSTLSGNTAADGGGIFIDGDNIFVTETATVNNSTLSGNTAAYGGGIYDSFGPLTVNNSIVANTSSGGDIVDEGGYTSSSHSLTGTVALGPLANNGGPTQTMALLPGSPALNAGDPAQLGVADQRGVVRNGGVNIGAYQASASAFVLTAPATVTAGTPFDLTVKAVDLFGQTALGYTGTVHFSSTDGQAVLPSDYPFTSGDAGMHTFPSGVMLKTAGNQTVTATDTATASITASATVAVTPAAADHLLFLQQPTDTAAGQMISPVIVEVVDAFGNVETSNNSDTIRLSLGTNPSGGTLSGTLTLTVVNGVATFSDLSIDLAGAGYTLHASTSGGLPDIDSNPFNITM